MMVENQFPLWLHTTQQLLPSHVNAGFLYLSLLLKLQDMGKEDALLVFH